MCYWFFVKKMSIENPFKKWDNENMFYIYFIFYLKSKAICYTEIKLHRKKINFLNKICKIFICVTTIIYISVNKANFNNIFFYRLLLKFWNRQLSNFEIRHRFSIKYFLAIYKINNKVEFRCYYLPCFLIETFFNYFVLFKPTPFSERKSKFKHYFSKPQTSKYILSCMFPFH